MDKFFVCSVFVVVLIGSCSAVPKKYESPKNPYSSEWRRSYDTNDKQNESLSESSTNDRTQRLGFATGYGNTGINGYPNSGSGVGVYSPMKIDLGGVILGALVGIGALLILPKFLGAFTGQSSGGYYRSVDDEISGVTQMLTKLDEYLGKNNIDSAACMQRAVCSYVKSSQFHTTQGTADSMEQLIHTLSGNSMVNYIIDGTAIKEAVENGKAENGRDCDSIYTGCPINQQSAMAILTNMLPKNGQ